VIVATSTVGSRAQRKLERKNKTKQANAMSTPEKGTYPTRNDNAVSEKNNKKKK
jgi:hypothetical protein